MHAAAHQLVCPLLAHQFTQDCRVPDDHGPLPSGRRADAGLAPKGWQRRGPSSTCHSCGRPAGQTAPVRRFPGVNPKSIQHVAQHHSFVNTRANSGGSDADSAQERDWQNQMQLALHSSAGRPVLQGLQSGIQANFNMGSDTSYNWMTSRNKRHSLKTLAAWAGQPFEGTPGVTTGSMTGSWQSDCRAWPVEECLMQSRIGAYMSTTAGQLAGCR
eukprot:364641-Chlamydomonas_euryale.AAC.12